MNKANKTYGYYNDLTINGNTYKTIKLSNGAENILKMPEGIKANRITIYSIINAENDSKVSGWKNVNGDQEYTKIPMGAYQGSGTDYDVRVYSLNNVTSQISFTNVGTQLGFVVALDIVDESEATADITIGENKMATYCNASAWTVPSEFEVYTAKYADSKVKLTKVEEGKVIKAGAGVVLYGEAKTYTVNLSTETGEELDNSLVGVTTDTKMDNETTYVLVKGTSGVCFGKLASGQTVTAGKAYLTINDADAAKTLSVDFGTTGINAVDNANDTVNGAYYTLSGQRTVKPVKGMYIHNGKKYIAK